MLKKSGKKEERKCVIGFKRAFSSDTHHLYGNVFDKLEPCCDQFKRLFFDTGHQKFNNFNSHLDERDGLNLVTRGSVLTLVLRISRTPGVIYEERVESCPFCGVKIEVKCTKSVELRPRTKQVPDGYDEEIKWQKGEQAQ
ncbi:MAG: hypothetical protein Q8Q89_00775 [bacterium]|nr:hypothetical protein [bacterium]